MARATLYFLAAALTGCSFEHGVASIPDASEMPVPDMPPSCMSFSSQVDTCMLTQVSDTLTIAGDYTYDTNHGAFTSGAPPLSVTHMQMNGQAGPMDVILVTDLRMMPNARLRAVGDLPLAILAWNTITIDENAIIDVSSGGAGARTTCPGGALDGKPDGGGAGGGGGGGFAAAGGSGGNGDKDGPPATPGGPGGAAATPPPLGPLGGCPGARGGDGDDTGGSGGAGGGAIYLVAAIRMDFGAGSGINAGGAGGRGGAKTGLNNGDAGGGGGGSGGIIMLEAPILRAAGTFAANGGAGGEGSGGGGEGDDGAPGALSTAAAVGGNGSSDSGTDGGAGGAQVSTAGGSVTAFDDGGGGGGGGGVGYVIIKSMDAVISVSSPNPS